MQWHYVKDGASQGPVDEATILALEAEGLIGPETLVWCEGMEAWKALGNLRRELPAPRPAAPKAAKAAVALGDAAPNGLEYASIGTRLGARIVDAVLFQGFSWVSKLLLGLSLTQGLEEGFLTLLALMVLNVLVASVYEVVMTAHYGGTLGKLALGIRVCDEDGTQLTLPRSFYRYLASVLSALTCLVGYLIAIGHPKKQTLHDRMVGTVVVRK